MKYSLYLQWIFNAFFQHQGNLFLLFQFGILLWVVLNYSSWTNCFQFFQYNSHSLNSQNSVPACSGFEPVEQWSIIWPKTPLKSDNIITISIRLSPSQILKFDVMFYFQSSIRNAIWNSHLHHQFLVTLLPPAGSTWQALWINKLHSGCN